MAWWVAVLVGTLSPIPWLLLIFHICRKPEDKCAEKQVDKLC